MVRLLTRAHRRGGRSKRLPIPARSSPRCARWRPTHSPRRWPSPRLQPRAHSSRGPAEPPARRDEWRLVRAAAHQALADRGSRLALYDLRESLHNLKRGMPVEFLGPLTAIGDASCLEAIAAEHAAARDPWWRQRLTEA